MTEYSYSISSEEVDTCKSKNCKKEATEYCRLHKILNCSEYNHHHTVYKYGKDIQRACFDFCSSHKHEACADCREVDIVFRLTCNMCSTHYDSITEWWEDINESQEIFKTYLRSERESDLIDLVKCSKCKKNIGIVCGENGSSGECKYLCWVCGKRNRKRPFEHESKEELNKEYNKLMLYEKIKENPSNYKYHYSEPSDPLTESSESESSESWSEEIKKQWFKSENTYTWLWDEKINSWLEP